MQNLKTDRQVKISVINGIQTWLMIQAKDNTSRVIPIKDEDAKDIQKWLHLKDIQLHKKVK